MLNSIKPKKSNQPTVSEMLKPSTVKENSDLEPMINEIKPSKKKNVIKVAEMNIDLQMSGGSLVSRE